MSRNRNNNTVALFGLPITDVTMAEAVVRIEAKILSGETHQIATANLDFARNALRDNHLQRVICECSMVLPDGAPMLWASRLFGKPLKERVTGVDLVPRLAKLSAEKGYGIYLLGSDEANSLAATRVLERDYPGVRIVGRYSPMIAPLHAMDDSELLERIEAARPDILLVAFGNPKQEIWIHRNRKRLDVPVSIGIGGSLDMIAGSLKRAPEWVQMLQLEWLFRMLQEPGRLLPRYAHDAAALIRHLPMGLAVNRLQPVQAEARHLRVLVRNGVRVVSTPETLTGDICPMLTREAKVAAAAAQMMIIDMSATTRIEADGMGCLLESRRVVLAEGLWIWLTGTTASVRRVLQFSALLDLFRLAETPVEAIRFATEGYTESERKATVLAMPAMPSMQSGRMDSRTKAAGA